MKTENRKQKTEGKKEEEKNAENQLEENNKNLKGSNLLRKKRHFSNDSLIMINLIWGHP